MDEARRPCSALAWLQEVTGGAAFRLNPYRTVRGYAAIGSDGFQGHLTLHLENLRTLTDKLPPAAFFYEAWLVTGAGQAVSAGAFNAGTAGTAGASFDLEPDDLHSSGITLAAISAVLVTAEPFDGNPAPATPILHGRLLWQGEGAAAWALDPAGFEARPTFADGPEPHLPYGDAFDAGYSGIANPPAAGYGGPPAEAGLPPAPEAPEAPAPGLTQPPPTAAAPPPATGPAAAPPASPAAELPAPPAPAAAIAGGTRTAATAAPNPEATAPQAEAPGFTAAQAREPLPSADPTPLHATAPEAPTAAGGASGFEPGLDPGAHPALFPPEGVLAGGTQPWGQPPATWPPAPLLPPEAATRPPGNDPLPGGPVLRAQTLLSGASPLTAMTQAIAQLDFAQGGLLLTLRGMPTPSRFGHAAATGREYNVFKAWLVNSRTRDVVMLGAMPRIWHDTYRIQVRDGLPLERYDTLQVTVEDRGAPAGFAGPIVLSGRYASLLSRR